MYLKTVFSVCFLVIYIAFLGEALCKKVAMQQQEGQAKRIALLGKRRIQYTKRQNPPPTVLDLPQLLALPPVEVPAVPLSPTPPQDTTPPAAANPPPAAANPPPAAANPSPNAATGGSAYDAYAAYYNYYYSQPSTTPPAAAEKGKEDEEEEEEEEKD